MTAHSRTPPALALALLLFVLPLPAVAMIIVSADQTPVFFLTDTEPNASTSGNQQFFQGVLEPGGRVGVLGASTAGKEIDEFYRGRSGGSKILSGSVAGEALGGLDLLVVPVPEDEFDAAEVSAIDGFVDKGGSVFLIGEAAALASAGNGFLNELLFDLGLAVSIDGSSLDRGPHVAVGSQIASHPLTQGIAAFNYGYTARVIGGTPLFSTMDGSPFLVLASGSGEVAPEPATWALLAAAALAFAGSRRRFRTH